MPNRRPERRPNALKHGVFSSNALLSGENPKEFNKLVRSLTDEFELSGAFEEETVLTLANCIWRRRRLDMFMERRRSRADYDALLRLKKKISEETEDLDESYRNQLQTDVQQAFSNVNSFTEGTIRDRLTPMFNLLGWDEESRTEWIGEAMDVENLPDVTLEELQRELDLQDRLEAMIDRCVKRFVYIKTSKRMMRIDSQTRAVTGSQVDRLALASAVPSVGWRNDRGK
jgi:hypothetical protein